MSGRDGGLRSLAETLARHEDGEKTAVVMWIGVSGLETPQQSKTGLFPRHGAARRRI
jgi:hypothetical protein